MDEQYKDIARRAAARLEQEFNLNLRETLEEYITSVELAQEQSYLESTEKAALAVAIVSVLLQAASFGHDIYKDLQKDSTPQIRIEQKLEMEIRNKCIKDNQLIPLEQQDRVVQVITEETLKSD